MSEELKPCPFCGNAPQIDQGLVSCPLCRMTWIPPNMWNTRRADLARPAPAEGAVREALRPFVKALEKTNEGFGFDVSEHYETANMVCQPYIRMEHFKAARDAFHASPEDATPAAPVSAEGAAKVLHEHLFTTYGDGVTPKKAAMDTLVQCHSISIDDGGRHDQLDIIEQVLHALAQQDRRAALREMQSIREEMEGESGE